MLASNANEFPGEVAFKLLRLLKTHKTMKILPRSDNFWDFPSKLMIAY